MKKPALLEMQNVQVKYGRHEVFSSLSLTLPADRCCAVIGPNGSGKSTLLKLISRNLYPVDSETSRFRILGQKPRQRDELRMRMGLVSHELQTKVDKESTVFDVVVSQFYSSLTTYVHQSYTPEQLAAAKDKLEFMGIDHLATARFVTVSTGEQRLCLLARALLHDPEYLILDEPTSGLDIKATHQYLNTMSRLIAKGKKIVLVTHHLHEILPEISWFVFLKNGELVGEGRRGEMLVDEKVSSLFDIPIQIDKEGGLVNAKVVNTAVNTVVN